jgi:hypothetical protein
MLAVLVLVSVAQFPVIMEQPVIYEMPVFQVQTMYRYSYVPVVRTVPTTLYSAPLTYYMRAEPLVPVYSPFWGGRTIIKERGPGFRSRTILRY